MNSMNDRYFQLFTCDFNDFKKIRVNSMNDRYFQIFTCDFNDFKKKQDEFNE